MYIFQSIIKRQHMGLVHADIELLNSRDVDNFEEGNLYEHQIRSMNVLMNVDCVAIMLDINENIHTQLGLRVGIIENQYWGGVCLNVGCIPTKALLRNAELVHILTSQADLFGIRGEFSFDCQRRLKIDPLLPSEY